MPLIELIHEQIRQTLSGFKFSRLNFVYDFQHKNQILCDSRQISRVFSNLLSNAAKYSKGEPPEITFKSREDSRSVYISVINSGVPIPVLESERIFEKFYTAKTNGISIKDGHGIGLTIVKKFTEANHGTVHCKPIPNFGTEFALSFKSAGTEDTSYSTHLFGSTSEIPQVASIILSKDTPLTPEEELLQDRIISLIKTKNVAFSVCIIDDEEIIRRSICSYISTSGLSKYIQVVEMSDYVDGIMYVMDHEPSLVLVDLAFRKEQGAGFLVLEKLKHITKPYKVIYTNNYIRTDELQKRHADDVIDKPMWRVDLFRLIIRVLERNQNAN